MGGKSSTLSWLTAPLRWTPVSAGELMEARRIAAGELFAHETTAAALGALGRTLVSGNDTFTARCLELLFGAHPVTLPPPDSAGGYNSVLSQLLQASGSELDTLVQNIIDSTGAPLAKGSAVPSAAAALEVAPLQ